jgi:hypothetical protein
MLVVNKPAATHALVCCQGSYCCRARTRPQETRGLHNRACLHSASILHRRAQETAAMRHGSGRWMICTGAGLDDRVHFQSRSCSAGAADRSARRCGRRRRMSGSDNQPIQTAISRVVYIPTMGRSVSLFPPFCARPYSSRMTKS